jgi:hypothetical protein
MFPRKGAVLIQVGLLAFVPRLQALLLLLLLLLCVCDPGVAAHDTGSFAVISCCWRQACAGWKSRQYVLTVLMPLLLLLLPCCCPGGDTQGVEYNVTWPASHAPANDVSIALFSGTDCDSAAPLATVGPVRPKVAGFEAFAPFTVPAPSPSTQQGSGYFLRVEDSVTGQRNYSEIFTLQPLQLQQGGGSSGSGGCVINPLLPPTQPLAVPAPRCSPDLKWNISAMPTGICEVQPHGCRYYR